ncbi:hypothetical protein [Anaerosacchariphilus polymeriproducens]|uniref:Lipoprotein n=1 Tax=Anaerosacchariphilus polymeriproducens TaxID=1812858 RepID=A0A371B064_9FIRM|nr:hypothetical protein [Anaerosacchariphilus polymeriproducens]RDU25207.1 hypothetical protein DWV06_00335 [Anaerosacchariphilus polymeriproducens]
MKKIKLTFCIGIFLVCMSVLVSCRNSERLKVSLDDSVFTIVQQRNKVILYVLNESCLEKKQIKITDVEEGAPVPVKMYQISKTELIILVGNNYGKPVQVYRFKADEGKLKKQGEIQADNTDCVIYKDKLYTYSYATEKSHKYWIRVFSINNIEQCEEEIEIAYAPEKMVVSEEENAIYFLLVGDKKATQLSKYLIDSKEMKNIVVDEKSFGSDIMFSQDKIYVSLEGYSENSEVIQDNRIIVYDKDLQKKDTFTTQNSPMCFTIYNKNIYIVSNDDRSSLQVISQNDKKVKEESIIDRDYKSNTIQVKNNVIYLATSNTIYVKDNEKVTNFQVNGEINLMLLSN